MRLIHATRLELQSFLGERIPDYVILSHTWGDEEVTLHEIQNRTARLKSGWQKITGACAQAARDEYEWVWIDSCCIDQSSSSELQEAINSMWDWYRRANICYVYLSDIVDEREGRSNALRNSRWWTRGWTLQELIAPDSLEFFARNWSLIGVKSNMIATIHEITTIDTGILTCGDPTLCNAAEKMSWMAHRRTTRPEDMAYCLMGLFGINMSTIYGEGGPKAFQRLQVEILQRDGDATIFLYAQATHEVNGCTAILASSPSQFCSCRDCRYADPQHTIARLRLLPPSVTYKSMQVETAAISPFHDNPNPSRRLVNSPDITLRTNGDIRGIFTTISPRSFITTPVDKLAGDVVWIVLNVLLLIPGEPGTVIGEWLDETNLFFAIPVVHMGGHYFTRLHEPADLVSIDPEPEGWCFRTPLLIGGGALTSAAVNLVFELPNNNRFSIVHDPVGIQDTNSNQNQSESKFSIKWDRERFKKPKYWVAQCMEQPECFLIFSARVQQLFRQGPRILHGVRPFSGSLEALQRHLRDIRAAADVNILHKLVRAEENAENTVIRMDGSLGSVSVRVRRMAFKPSDRRMLDVDARNFRYKVHATVSPPRSRASR